MHSSLPVRKKYDSTFHQSNQQPIIYGPGGKSFAMLDVNVMFVKLMCDAASVSWFMMLVAPGFYSYIHT